MTREEAIRKLQKQKSEYLEEWVDYSGVAEAYDMAIEALQREEAEANGYCHRIKPKEYFKIDDMVKVVRCKDCKHYGKVTTNYGICYERPNVITSQRADDFCSYGECKGGDSE